MKTNKEMCQNYYKKNKEQLREKRRNRYLLNKTVELQKSKDYQRLHPDKIKSYQSKCYLKNKIRYMQSAAERKKLQIQDNISFVNDVLSHSKCCDCNCNLPACLDFHHIESKRNTITRMKFNGCSINSLEKEIKNCVVLCSNCHRKKHAKKLNHANKKVQFVYKIKSSGCCFTCGLIDIPQVFDFHHIKDKVDNINSMTHKKEYTLQDIISEIKKCILLCSNCHRQYHSESSSSEEILEIGSPVKISSWFVNL